ncbi:uncharacterized protein LOC122816385 [Protopterus annectens]|uniref:uncharacterized protein LOC122816385 n=1 Tax=Protopterus annectens TaxID=7888 RepID=UPI001CFB9211|nr:uncharacterized protein LOC122816385 [Protopterus annectens]
MLSGGYQTFADALPKPWIFMLQSNGALTAGEEVVLNCTTPNNYTGSIFYFYRNARTVHLSEVNATSAVYNSTEQHRNQNAELDGTYSCQYSVMTISGAKNSSISDNVFVAALTDDLDLKIMIGIGGVLTCMILLTLVLASIIRSKTRTQTRVLMSQATNSEIPQDMVTGIPYGNISMCSLVSQTTTNTALDEALENVAEEQYTPMDKLNIITSV